MPIIADLAAVSGLSIDQTTQQIVRAFSAGIGSADLFRERGIVAMLGFEAGATISAANTRRKIIAEWEKTGSKFRGTAEDLAKTWTGITGMLADRWFIFKNLVADAGLFDIVKRAADGLVRKLNELADTGKLNEFAQATSDTIVKIVNSTVRGVAFVAGKLIDIVEFFRSIPIATGFGLVGLVFFGPTGGAVLAALGLGIDKLAEKLFGATTVSGRFAENIAEAQAEAGRLAQTLASGGGDPAAIHKRMQELNVIIDINTRLLTRMDEEAGITFGSLREMLAGFEDFSIESLFGSDPVTVTAELNELLLVTHDSLRVAITASAEFTANLKRASEEATEAAKKFLDWQKQMDRMGETIQNQLIGGIGEVLLQLDDVLGTIKSIGRAILREIIANLARAAAAGESLGSVLKGAGSFGLIGAGIGIASQFFHEGGIVQPPRFAAAGGGNVPAMLQTGEVVLSRATVGRLGGPAAADQLNQGASGQGGGVPFVFDPSRLPAATNPLAAARDGDWVAFLSDSIAAWEENGGRLRG